jgi:hypothetical protein
MSRSFKSGARRSARRVRGDFLLEPGTSYDVIRPDPARQKP